VLCALYIYYEYRYYTALRLRPYRGGYGGVGNVTRVIYSIIGLSIYLTLNLVGSRLAAPKLLVHIISAMLVLTLYQVWVFFTKMYETSKWTVESARFVRSIIQAF
jgi:hypothetical protein